MAVEFLGQLLGGFRCTDKLRDVQLVMEKEASNQEFAFLYNLASPDHVYYRWRLYSLAQGAPQAQRVSHTCRPLGAHASVLDRGSEGWGHSTIRVCTC